MANRVSVRRARHARGGSLSGVIITWDVDSRDAAACARVRRFVFGNATAVNGRKYRHEGFVACEGVRYLGQSVLFVPMPLRLGLEEFLRWCRVEHVVTEATLGSRLTSWP